MNFTEYIFKKNNFLIYDEDGRQFIKCIICNIPVEVKNSDEISAFLTLHTHYYHSNFCCGKTEVV